MSKQSTQNLKIKTKGPVLPPPLEHNNIIYKSDTISKILEKIKRFAISDQPVHIKGDTGTGKEIFAKLVHALSGRKNKKIISENIAVLEHEHINSLLFGHVKGGFTGAQAARTGLFKLAENGTVFLDEIGDMPKESQVKLLRVIQERQFRPLGSDSTFKFNARLVTATHRNLEEMVREGTFREDLFYRLNVLPLEIPPLRERREDIPILAQHFVDQEVGLGEVELSSELESFLINDQYRWPGNVRELENIVKRCRALANNWCEMESLIRQEVEKATEKQNLYSMDNSSETVSETIRHHLDHWPSSKSRRPLGDVLDEAIIQDAATVIIEKLDAGWRGPSTKEGWGKMLGISALINSSRPTLPANDLMVRVLLKVGQRSEFPTSLKRAIRTTQMNESKSGNPP